jgi:rubredoxin
MSFLLSFFLGRSQQMQGGGMSSEVVLGNRYAYWYELHRRDFDHELSAEALEMVAGAVEAGEITTLDGVRSPLSRRIAAHHGIDMFEMNSNWACSPQSWECPCCQRNKFQVSRPGSKGQILAKLVIHHDHMGEALRVAFLKAFREAGTDTAQIDGSRLVDRMSKAFAAYQEVLLCEDCNNADAKAKKLLGSPSFFSFSASQIRGFIRSSDHRPHEIDSDRAWQMWSSAKDAYELRMRLIADVSYAAATNSHWFEAQPRNSQAIPVFGERKGFSGDSIIEQWVSSESLAVVLGRNTSVTTPNFSRWRTEKALSIRSLPHNFLAILCSNQHHAQAWDALSGDWHCPICKRSKQDTVEVGAGGKLGINHKGGPGKGAWASVHRFCNHCFSVFSALKREVTQILGVAGHSYDAYAMVSPVDIANIITARANSPHKVKDDLAKQLVDRVVSLSRKQAPSDLFVMSGDQQQLARNDLSSR